MKKIALILCLVLVASFVLSGCNNSDSIITLEDREVGKIEPARGICAKTVGSASGSHCFFVITYISYSYLSISAVIMDFAFDVSSAQYSPSRRYTGISSSVRFKSTTVIRPSFSNAVTSILSVYLVTPIRCAPAFRKCVKCHMVPAAAVFLNVTADILCPALPVFRL